MVWYINVYEIVYKRNDLKLIKKMLTADIARMGRRACLHGVAYKK